MSTGKTTPVEVGSNLGLGPNAQDVGRESVDDALMIVESYGPWGADLNDAHRRQIVLADEVKRMTGMSEALQDEWDRECCDTDKLLRALGLEPATCRTDGGSLKLVMLLGALEHRDVMLKREAREAERDRCELDAPAEQVRHCAQRALDAWDSTVLPKNHDGMMFERMEDLRAALTGTGA